ncbi:hypothetical protein [Mycoplasma tauri]|uniref:Lipoprotein n=2 Tax=Mycoplasma tauri TaxID=547987 RepID=A0A953NGR5_9MOLU|nr:hypothetical protein [Mycoplasma tauri]MBZ4195386.1 hypothetical protein [Mycoplasma tauri]MBZ4218493.1 hypothetical protein [Mycoplasma tauri]
MKRTKRTFFVLSSCLAISLPIVATVSCGEDNFTRIGNELSFRNMGVLTHSELNNALAKQPYKKDEFTIYYPSDSELIQEAKIIEKFLTSEGINKDRYRESYETFVNKEYANGKSPSLKDFTNDYLWGRGLIKIDGHPSVMNHPELDISINDFRHTGAANQVVFRLDNKKNKDISDLFDYGKPFRIELNNKLKEIDPINHTHMTLDILKNNKENLEVMLLSNESKRW